MGISLKPARLRRYRDIARLILRYGGSDAVRQAGLEDAVDGASENGSRVAMGESLTADLERLGPTFVKLGQVLATREDLLPREYTDALARLQDRVAPVPFEVIEQTVRDDLGIRVSKAFAEFDPRPLASASLGQVHRAVMHDGRVVAVKVQRPGIREQVDEDLDALSDIAEFVDSHTAAGRAYSFTSLLDEFRKSLYRELDYRREADNLLTLRANLAEFERIVVPEPVSGFVSDRVLTMEYIRGRKITKLSPLVRLELDGRDLADQLFTAYLKQILVDGFFHADPHPGNVFLTDDRRLALLDLGMTATLTPGLQEDLLKLVLATAEGRAEDALTVIVKVGQKLPEYDERKLARAVADLIADYRGRTVEQVQVGRRLMEMGRVSADAGFRMPSDLSLLARALINLDQVGRILDPSFDPNESIRANAADILERRLVKSATPGSMFASVLEARDFAVRVPGQVNRILESLATNSFEVHVRAFDEDRLMSGIHKVANRITTGLVLSALIVGAALLMRVQTSFEILGYPGIAMIFFLLAAIGGFGLVVAILRDR
ncbi:MAG TPA: AarF/UbiB family protein [Candidatus Dormibacteraeota bacterium]|nr:AarF/UbiB family protein [Candidatus Dormibacteraeota bacterium]